MGNNIIKSKRHRKDSPVIVVSHQVPTYPSGYDIYGGFYSTTHHKNTSRNSRYGNSQTSDPIIQFWTQSFWVWTKSFRDEPKVWTKSCRFGRKKTFGSAFLCSYYLIKTNISQKSHKYVGPKVLDQKFCQNLQAKKMGRFTSPKTCQNRRFRRFLASSQNFPKSAILTSFLDRETPVTF